jgi:glycosyltransferase involved in cell wall biosynthesis
VNYLYEDNFLVTKAVQRADHCFSAANLLVSKARKKYRLMYDPMFLASPVPFLGEINKSLTPLVCFVARVDRRKRPYLFFELASRFPDVQFEAIGIGQDSKWEKIVRSQYTNLANLKFHGFLDQFIESRLSNIWNKAWILVNTSVRESLPTTFIEATGNGCAILSETNPDQFASEFGYHAVNGEFDLGLKFLLEENRWRTLGQKGRNYSMQHYGVSESLRQHIEIYKNII